MSQFEWLGVRSEIVRAVEEMDWLLPTPVQDEAIPLILGGGDVMIAAETGSGKTGSFAIPIIQQIYESLRGEAQVSVDDGKDAGPPRVASAVQWDSHDRDKDFAIAPDGYGVQTRNDRSWEGARANLGLTKGKHYYEGTLTDEGISRVGWSTANGVFNIGTDGQSFGYGGTAMKSHNGFEKYGERYLKGDTVGCYIDLDVGKVAYSKNGTFLGEAFDIPPNLRGVPLYPAVVLKNAEMHFNFGHTAWKYPPNRSGYKGVSQADSSEMCSLPKKRKGTATPKHNKGGGGGGRNNNSPNALIIEPTQELANQVAEEIEKFVIHLHDPPVTYALASGGVNMSELKRQLNGGVNIIVGTIGVVKSLLRSRTISLDKTNFFVLDEADQLLDQGNKPDIMDMYKRLPTSDVNMQLVICSATLHTPGIRELTDSICKRPQWVDLKGKDAVPETVDHVLIELDPNKDNTRAPADVPHDQVHDMGDLRKNNRDTNSLKVKLLKPQVLLEVIKNFKIDQALVFCRTRVDCDNIADFLTKRGGGRGFNGRVESGKENPYSCTVLHGGKGQGRQVALDAFREGDVRFLICTDVAARGIDIKELPFVINVTLPDPSEQYIHRIGRVGRAGCPGLAISLFSPVQEKVWWHTCASKGRGNQCRRRNLVDQGGCCKWFDEPALIREIETRLSAGKEGAVRIPRVSRHEMTKGREKAAAGRSAPKGSVHAQASAKHVALLRPAVQELAKLEVSAQKNYLRFAHQSTWKSAPEGSGGWAKAAITGNKGNPNPAKNGATNSKKQKKRR